jgi:RNA polymerase sigma-70 factor (ECF subfamily)
MDRDLVVRARAGDRDAFSQLARASLGRLNAVARLIVRDATGAEDAVQETLVNAWLDLPGLRDPDKFGAWLNRLLIRACHHVARSDWRRRRLELPLIQPETLVTPDVQFSSAQADALERALRRLTIDQRTVLVLSFYLDFPLSEMATTLGVPVGTVKSRLHRAISALRATLDAEERPTYVGSPS